MRQSNFKKFLLLWSGELISAIGGGLTSFGLGVYIFQLTGKAEQMAIITLLGFLPTLLLSIPAGALADRYDRRVLMMLGDGLSAIGVIYILVRMLMGNAQFVDICIGVTVSSVFSSLLEPSYRATVTDLLSPEEYSKASGLVSIAGSARYLISPVIAGLILAVCDVSVLLIIDISTFAVTLASTFAVKRGIAKKERTDRESILKSIVSGWKTLKKARGVLLLTIISAFLTLFIGAFQILAEPAFLSFTNAQKLGLAETICASGMLISSLFIGIRGLKKKYVRTLSFALAFGGIFIALFGIWENMLIMTIFGFLFFFMLPFANTSLDYLVRTNIAEEMHGRVWGFIGFMSQIGYVVAYALCGFLADFIAEKAQISVGRGAGVVMVVSGIMLALISLLPILLKSIRKLES